MYSDDLVLSWLQVYKNVTSFSFEGFFPLGEKELNLLSKGLHVHLDYFADNQTEFAIIYDEINEELANALGTWRGTSLSFIFPGQCSDLEHLVEETIKNGLLFMRIKGEYLGMSEVDSGV